MSDLYKEHIDITNEVKESIQKLKVVFPAEYNRLYAEKAQSHHIELKPNQIISSEMLDERMVRHLITLSQCTDDALRAIETEDKQLLKIVLNETKALQEEVHELQKIIYEDALTKSYNRRWFEDTLCSDDHISIRESGTLVMVDLNKFKHINDTYGHIVGDKVLIHVAFKLKETGGRVVRYGGDEFIIIFDSKISPNEIQTKMTSMIEHCKHIYFIVDQNKFKINFAYGMVPFTKGALVEHIIEAADREMYHDKSGLISHDNVI